MWALQSVSDAGLCFWLPPGGKPLRVGRKDCDVILEGEKSISRKHALLHVTPEAVSVTDCSSTFGTAVNGQKLAANKQRSLVEADLLAFGHSSSAVKFKLRWVPLLFCCSGMPGAERRRTRELAKALGGRLVNEWSSEVTHLVMNSLMVTVKVVCALSSCCPVVTPGWLEESARALAEGRVLPQPGPFLPEVVDCNAGVGPEGFAPDFRRKKLFLNRIFYFLSAQQFSRLSQCIRVGGARSVLATQAVAMETFLAREAVVVCVDSDAMTSLSVAEKKWAGQVHHFLEQNGLRAVLDSEIGYALLHISTETHCNPQRAEAPPISTPLPGPTLSQFDPEASQQPVSQELDGSAVSTITVLAADTEPSQMLASSESKANSQRPTGKIEETVMYAKDGGAVSATLSQASASKIKLCPSAVGMKVPLQKAKSPSPSAHELSPQPAAMQQEACQEYSSHSEPRGNSVVEDSQPGRPHRAPACILPGLKQSRTSSLSIENSPSLQSVGEPSVLAPSSLTPGSPDAGRTWLPDSALFGELFRGKRKMNSSRAAAEEEEDSNPAKKQCLDEHSALSKSNGTSNHCQTAASSSSDLEMQVQHAVPSGVSEQHSSHCMKPLESSCHLSPPRRPTPAGFLSKRGRSSEAVQGPQNPLVESTPMVQQSTPLTAPRPSSTCPTSNPFTSLFDGLGDSGATLQSALRGWRLKRPSAILPRHIASNDDIWEEAEGEREDPLAAQNKPENTECVYKPALTDDGFILPRVKPTLLKGRDWSEGNQLEGPGGRQKTVLQRKVDIKVNIKVVGLQTAAELNTLAVVDFKKFRKCDQGPGGLPRIVPVKAYRPPVRNKLPDWSITEEPREDSGEDTPVFPTGSSFKFKKVVL